MITARSHPLSLVAERPVLLKAWDRSQERQLTLIVAPPGYGKTALLKTWWTRCMAAKQRTAWLSLHAFDSFSSVVRKLIVSIETAKPVVRAESEDVAGSAPVQALRAALGAALDAFAVRGEQLTVFIDNYAACGVEIQRVFADLLATAAGGLHLVIAVRVRPELLPIASLAARDELVLIESEDLAFELGDTERFVGDVLELSLRPRVLRDLHERAEGWPAGLRLLSTGAVEKGADCEMGGNDPSLLLDSFFSHEVLRHLSEPAVQAVERLAYLRRWNPAMAADILAPSGAALLETLIGSRFFTCDAGGGQYRLHGLFGDYLRRRYATRVGRAALRELHHEAAALLARSGQWADSVEHAFAAEDSPNALRAAERCALELIDKGETTQLRSWLQRLDAAQVYRHPKLCLAGALLHYACREPEQALRYLDAGAAQSLAQGSADSEVFRQLQLLRGIYPICCDDSEAGRQALARGLGVPAAGALSEPASAVCEAWCLIYEQGPAAASAFLKQRSAVAGCRADTVDLHRQNLAGLAALLAADLDQSAAIYRHMLMDACRVQGPDGPMAALAAAGLARQAYERGDFDEVDALLQGRLAMIEESGSIEGMMSAYCSRIRTDCARGAFAHAAENLAKVQALAEAHRLDRLKIFCGVENVHLCIAQRRFQEAQAFCRELRETGPRRGDRRSVAGATLRMAEYAKAMLLVALGEPQFAVESLEVSAEEAYAGGFYLEAAASLALLAIALNLTARRREARKFAARALLIGQKGQLLRTFVDCGAAFSPLLQELRRERLTGKHEDLRCDYLDCMLSHLNHTRSADPSPATADSRDTTLSARELQITSLLSTGLSNKEIGRTMGLSNETVKWHLKNIYDKLAVEDRADAISKSIRLAR